LSGASSLNVRRAPGKARQTPAEDDGARAHAEGEHKAQPARGPRGETNRQQADEGAGAGAPVAPKTATAA